MRFFQTAVGRTLRNPLSRVLLAAALAALPTTGAHAQETILHSFQTGVVNDGYSPWTPPVQDPSGNVFGATAGGGAGGLGTIFTLNASNQETVLHSFQDGSVSGDGEAPNSFIRGTDGNYYGTTGQWGSSTNPGTVFKITPSGQETILHSFQDGSVANDGSLPIGILQGNDGNFYGTTYNGGSAGEGTAYMITPSGQETILHSFGDGSVTNDGTHPWGGLIQGNDGNFYGDCGNGGAAGYGTVFKITPTGQETVLHSFGDGTVPNDGLYPQSAPVQGLDGNLYGTTTNGGAAGTEGTFYRITPAGQETVLHSFGDGTVPSDGADPWNNIIQGTDGNFYGTTGYGGSANLGTIYRITPSGLETVLHSFADGSVANDGSGPNGIAEGVDGNLYGSTVVGGAADYGTVYEFATNLPPVYSFITIDDPTAPGYTQFNGINDSDDIVGGYGSANPDVGEHGLFYFNGQFSAYDEPDAGLPTYGSAPNGINSYGQTAGYFRDFGGNWYGYYTNGPFNTLNDPLADPANYGTIAAGIDDSGQVVGQYRDNANGIHGFLYSYGSYTTIDDPLATVGLGFGSGTILNGINNAGLMVGTYSDTNGNYHGLTYDGGTFTTLDDPNGTGHATTEWDGVNNLGQMVGNYADAGGVLHGVLYSNGAFETLDDPNAGRASGEGTWLNGINDYGEIVGYYADSSGYYHSFIANPASQPPILTATAGNTQVSLSWSPSSEGASYDVYRGTQSGAESATPIAVGISTTGYTDTGLFNYTWYYYTVVAISPAGTSAPSNEASAFPIPPPLPPVNLTATAGISQVALSWVGGGGSFNIYRGTAAGAEGNVPIASGQFTYAGVSLLYTDTGLTNGVTYYYKVNAFNSAGPSGFTNEASATPEATTPSPVANADTYSIPEGKPLNIPAPGVLGIDTDAFDDPLTAVLVSNPYNGSLTLNADGSFTYTPNVGFLGTDTFTYQAQDSIYSGLLSNIATVTIDVSPLGSYTSSNGITPRTGLTPGPGGLLYGVDSAGGANGDGTVFTVSPSGQVTTLYNFSGLDGQDPQTQLVVGGDGNLYGTTLQGGPNNTGTIFKITSAGTLTTIHPWGGSDLTVGVDGDLYGTTYRGGANDAGSIFKIGLDGSAYTTLYSFSGSGADGGYPAAGLTLASDGNFYGTTTGGVIEGTATIVPGTVFQFTPAGDLNTLHDFNDTDGSYVAGKLVQGSDGNLYGTSALGGSAGAFAGQGSIFKISTTGAFVTFHTFAGPDGGFPYAGLMVGTDGNLYGVTAGGGTNGDGTVFRLALSGTLTTLYTFSGPDGAAPRGALTEDSNGALWGATAYGGSGFTGAGTGNGTVFSLALALTAPSTTVPVANNDAYTTQENQTLTVTAPGVLGNDTDVAGDPLTTVPVSSPANGSLTLNSNGSFTYAPHTGFVGTDTFTYKAKDASNPALVSNTATVTISVTAPGPAAPTALHARAGDTLVSLWWTASAGATSYSVYRGTASGAEGVTAIASGIAPTAYTDTGLTNGTTYFYTVAAVSGAGTSGPSNEVDATPEAYAAPSAPALTAVGGDAEITLSWTAITGATAYSVYRGTASGSEGATAYQTGIAGTSYTDTGLPAATTYFYKVTAINGYGASRPSNEASAKTLSFSSIASTVADGITPRAGLTPGLGGVLYGVDSAGGVSGDGTVFTVSPNGQITTLYAFSGPDGQDPQSQLVLAPDGNFYGTTLQGGPNNAGTIFKITPAGTLTTLYPRGGSDLTAGPDGDLYGTTYYGGANNAGSIFKIGLHGGGYGYATLYSFSGSGSDGGYPVAGVTLASDGKFYGTTTGGALEGSSSLIPGTIFQFTPAGQLNTLHDFNDVDGSYVAGRLVQAADGNLYGTSALGGNANGFAGQGSVFDISTSGVFNTVHTFSGPDGGFPYAGLMLGTDGNLYGVTSGGGSSGNGTVFQLGPSGSSFTTILSFDGPGGAAPRGSLAQGSDGAVWGTTEYGGTGFTGSGTGNGTVFSLGLGLPAPPPIVPGTGGDGSAPPAFSSFANTAGIAPRTGLTLGLGGVLYGVDSAGGTYGDGDVFTVSPSGQITTVYAFSGPDGQTPQTQLVLAPDGNFYGTTLQGGPNNAGTIFRITPTGTLTTLYSSGGSDLTVGPDGDLYGTSYMGGANNAGSIFKISLSGAGYTTLYSFSGSGSDGGYPAAGLTLASDGNFYGTTTGGALEGSSDLIPGTVFQFTPGGQLNTLHDFNDVDGSYVAGRLVQASDGNLYGTSALGGSANGFAGVGSIFKISTAGVFSTVHTFAGSDGAFPYAALMVGTDGNLYGVTASGGASGAGTVFQLALSGSSATLFSFFSFHGPDGAGPRGSLVQGSDGSLWGTTEYGGGGYAGLGTGDGTVFSLNAFLPSPEPTIPPLANSDGYSVAAGQTLTVAAPGVLGNDTDIYGDPLTAVSATGPSNGSVTLGGNGSFTYTPHAGFAGTDTFTYLAKDSTYPALVSSPATVTIAVTGIPVTVATAANATPNPVTGKTTNLNVIGAYAGTGGAGVLTYVWSSTGPAAVTFSANGTTAARNSVATFSMAGSYTFTATITGPYGQTATSSVNVTVNSTLASVAVTPGPTLALTVPATQTFTATADDQFGNPLATQPAFTWTLVGGSVGSLVNNVYSTAGVPGTATVKAKTGSIFGSVAITVNPAPVTVATPANASPSPVTGRTTNLNVLGAYAGASGPGILTYTWSSTGPAAVSFSANGTTAARNSVATFSAAGSYTLTATIASPYTSITSSVNVTVTQTYTSVAVSPGPTLTLTAPATQQFTATALDQFGNPLASQPVFAWSLAAGNVGSLTSPGGLYHSGTSPGSATIKAKSGSLSATVAVTVNPAPVTVATAASANPNPAPSTMTNLSALGAYAGPGGAASLTYTWSVSGPAAVTYSANGTNAAGNTIATFTKAGAYTFTVTIASAYTSTTSSVNVTVTQTVTSIAVNPGPTLTLGPPLPQTQQFSAAALDQFGNALSPQPTFAWSLASGSVGSITSGAGLYHSGTVTGSATVKAKSGAVMGTCAVTVN